MKIYKTTEGIIVENEGKYWLKKNADWDQFINRQQLRQAVLAEIQDLSTWQSVSQLDEKQLLAPIGMQEIWAAGVTYYRSKAARMEEAAAAGGGDFYDRVYDAERPEIFFKGMGYRAVGHGGKVRIRRDSTWDVPEPEFTLFICSEGTVEGYTIGNDMSSRSIEGQNPLYLPQAKTYDGCAGLGPCLYVPAEPLPRETEISVEIRRLGEIVFEGEASLAQMKRTFEELKGFLLRETTFPVGCYYMTGTCIVPGHDFTLQSGDEIYLTIPPIGTMLNVVA
jgi:2-dehydro-3-deoxy-D-arabinonate dehydratase